MLVRKKRVKMTTFGRHSDDFLTTFGRHLDDFRTTFRRHGGNLGTTRGRPAEDAPGEAARPGVSPGNNMARGIGMNQGKAGKENGRKDSYVDRTMTR